MVHLKNIKASWRSAVAALSATFALLCLGIPSQAAETSPPQFSKGFPRDPGFFPIGVWFQEPRDAAAYKSIGINTFVGLWNGPTEAQLAALAEAGMHTAATQNETGLSSPNAHVIKAWLHVDEPDNAQPLALGVRGDCILPEEIVRRYETMASRDPTRPVLLPFGQGVANTRWRGRGRVCSRIGHETYYASASRGGDILEFGIHPVTEYRQSYVYGRLEYVALGASNLARWANERQSVWTTIGVTHINDRERRPTPSQVRSMAWMALIAGARGLVYFVHEWQPAFNTKAIFEYPEIVSTVKELNAQITGLAPILQAATPIQITAVPGTVAAIARVHEGALYVFAVNLSDATNRVRLTVRENLSRSGHELGGSRVLETNDGAFEDAFDGYGVHLYVFDRPRNQ